MAMEQPSGHDRQGETAILAGERCLAGPFRPRPGEGGSALSPLRRRGMDAESIWSNLNRQVFLGDDAFVARVQPVLRDGPSDISIPKAQQRPPAPPLEEIAAHYPTRDAAIAAAHATGAYSYQQIGEVFGLHFTTVGRIVRAARKVGTL
jgi:hypothetical protein